MSKKKKKVKIVKRQTLGAKKDKQGFLLKARSAEVIPRYQVYAVAVVFLCFFIGSVRFNMAPFVNAYANLQPAIAYADGANLIPEPGEAGPDNFFIAFFCGFVKKIAGANPLILTNIMNYAAFLFILLALGKRAYREEDDIPDIAQRFSGFWLVALHPAMWIYVTSGIETVLFTAFMTAGFLLLIDYLEYDTPPWQSGLALGLAAMVRPEAVFFVAGAFALTIILGRPETKLKDAAIGAAASAVIFAPFAALRLAMGGTLFDGAFYALTNFRASAVFGPGAGYMAVWLITNIIAVATIIIGLFHVVKDSPIRTRSIAGTAWLLGLGVLAIIMGGDNAPYGRLYLPAIPVVAWMMADQWPLIAQWLHDRGTVSLKISRWASQGLIVLSLIWPIFYPAHFSDYRSWLGQSKEHRTIGRRLHKLTSGVKTTMNNAPSPVMQYHSGFSTSNDPAIYYVSSFPKDIESKDMFYDIVRITDHLRKKSDITDRYTLMKLNETEQTVVFLIKKEAIKVVREAFTPLNLLNLKSTSNTDS